MIGRITRWKQQCIILIMPIGNFSLEKLGQLGIARNITRSAGSDTMNTSGFGYSFDNFSKGLDYKNLGLIVREFLKVWRPDFPNFEL